jgi:Skp family chaperone for outer membrane proteins
MIEAIKAYWKLAVVVVLIAIGFAAGWYIQGNRWDADSPTQAKQYANNMKAVSDASAKQLAAEQAKGQALQAKLATLDSQYNQELANEKATNDNLRRQLNAGSPKLRVRPNTQQIQAVAAQCPKIQPPTAWAMTPSSNSLQILDQTFSISDPGLSVTKPN